MTRPCSSDRASLVCADSVYTEGAVINSRNRVIYLSGPMSGIKDFNYPAFHSAASCLRADGHLVYNPAEFAHDGPLDQFPIRKAFAEYAAFICLSACTLVLLPGWERSLGVSAELALAKNCRLDVIAYEAAP